MEKIYNIFGNLADLLQNAERNFCLVIEDEKPWSQKLAYDLGEFGYTIAGQADSFGSAINAIYQSHFDVALIDFNLDDKNGSIDLGKIITHICKKPFIFIIGAVENEMVQASIEARPLAFLTKPVARRVSLLPLKAPFVILIRASRHLEIKHSFMTIPSFL